MFAACATLIAMVVNIWVVHDGHEIVQGFIEAFIQAVVIIVIIVVAIRVVCNTAYFGLQDLRTSWCWLISSL